MSFSSSEHSESLGLLTRCYRRYLVCHSVHDVWFPRLWFSFFAGLQILTGSLLYLGQIALSMDPNYGIQETHVKINLGLGSTAFINGLVAVWFTLKPSSAK